MRQNSGQASFYGKTVVPGGAVLAIIGLVLVIATGLFTFASAVPGPGKIVPRQSMMTWQGPEGPKSTKVGAFSTDEAFAKFELENRGGLPVRILDMQSSCGCLAPKIETMTIEPGKVAVVEARALPIDVGEKLATVILRTDSPLTPEVVLQLRMIGGRRPPYLLQAAGELTWMGDEAQGSRRTIAATNVEWADSRHEPPKLECTLPFLKVGSPDFEEEPYTKPGVVQRRYIYQIGFVSKPPLGVFSGEVRVFDPWDPRHVERILIHGETFPPIRVFPSRMVLRLRTGDETRDVKADFLVRTAEPAPDLTLEAERAEESPLLVGSLRWVEEGRRATFSVGVKQGRAREGVFPVVIRRPSSPTERVVVPIALRVEDER